jgi:hypothetical protein
VVVDVEPDTLNAHPEGLKRATGRRQALRQNDCGVLVPRKIPALLGHAIVQVAAESDTRARIRRAGRRPVKRDYAWPSMNFLRLGLTVTVVLGVAWVSTKCLNPGPCLLAASVAPTP